MRNLPAILIGVCTALASCVQCLGWQQNGMNRDDNLQVVKDYLVEIGLESKVISLLEDELANERDAQRREKLASELAENYGEALFRYSENTGLIDRAENLLQVYPGLEAPILSVAILQSRFRQETQKVEAAWRQGQLYRSYRPGGLDSIWKQLESAEQRIRKREGELRRILEIDQQDNRAGQRFKKYSIALLYTQYLKGWTLYFRALTQLNNQRSQLLEQAELAFREFFEVEADAPILKLKSTRFQGESWEQSAMTGWASVVRMRGRINAAEHLFAIAKEMNRQRPVLQIELQTAGYAFDFDGIFDRIELALKDSSSPILQRSQLARTAFEWTCQSNLQVQSDNTKLQELERARLRANELALKFLLTHEQAGILQSCLESGCFRTGGNQPLELWRDGLIAFAGSQSDSEALLLASDSIRKAIEKIEQFDALESVCLRMLYGKVLLQQKEFKSAVVQLSAALQTPAQEGTSLKVAEIHWWLGQAYKRIDGDVARQNAIQHFYFIARNAPGSKRFKHAQFEALKLEAKTLPNEEALRRFSNFNATGDLRDQVQLEGLKCRARQTLEAQRNDAKPRLDLSWLSEADDLISDTEARTAIRIQTLLLKLDFLFRIREAKSLIQNDVETARQLGQLLPTDDPLQVEILYSQVRLARAQPEEPQKARELTVQLLQHPRASRHRIQSSLIYLVEQLEQEPPTTESLSRKIELLEQLLDSMQSDVSHNPVNRNAKAAASQLGRAYLQAQRWEKAAKLYHRLNNEFPDHSQILIGLAKARMGQMKGTDALPLWRRVVAGVRAGSDDWFEAKLGIVLCLAESNPQQANKILLQTRQLAGTIPEGWRTRFERVQAQVQERLSRNR